MDQDGRTERLTEAERLDLAKAAVREFRTQCFWFWRENIEVGTADIPEIARGLRQDGGRRGFLLAAKLCR
jgi:hypothetical protein